MKCSARERDTLEGLVTKKKRNGRRGNGGEGKVERFLAGSVSAIYAGGGREREREREREVIPACSAASPTFFMTPNGGKREGRGTRR